MMGCTFSSEERNTCRILVRKLLEKCSFRSERVPKVTLQSVLEKQLRGLLKWPRVVIQMLYFVKTAIKLLVP
jgi:hypothetical protein